MDYGTRLKVMRLARGMKQQDLEVQLGLSYAALSPIEQNRTLPAPELEQAIRLALNWTEVEDQALELLARAVVTEEATP